MTTPTLAMLAARVAALEEAAAARDRRFELVRSVAEELVLALPPGGEWRALMLDLLAKAT